MLADRKHHPLQPNGRAGSAEAAASSTGTAADSLAADSPWSSSHGRGVSAGQPYSLAADSPWSSSHGRGVSAGQRYSLVADLNLPPRREAPEPTSAM